MSTTMEEPPPVHPKVRARRAEVRRDEGRRRLRILIASASVLAVLGVCFGVTRSPLLDVDHVRVAGAVRTGPEAVLERAGALHDKPMTSVDPGSVRARLGELPWIDDVSVRRRWPGTIDIVVTERTPVALSADASGVVMLLDASGRVLGPLSESDDQTGLVRLGGISPVGPPGTTAGSDAATALVAVRDLRAQLPSELAAQVAWVLAEGDDEVVLRLVDGAEVLLGKPADGSKGFADAFLALDAVLTQVDPRGIELIDLRVPSAPTVRRA